MPILSDKHIQFGSGDIVCTSIFAFGMTLNQIRPIQKISVVFPPKNVLSTNQVYIRFGIDNEESLSNIDKFLDELRNVPKGQDEPIVITINDITFEFCGEQKYDSIGVIIHLVELMKSGILPCISC